MVVVVMVIVLFLEVYWNAWILHVCMQVYMFVCMCTGIRVGMVCFKRLLRNSQKLRSEDRRGRSGILVCVLHAGVDISDGLVNNDFDDDEMMMVMTIKRMTIMRRA